MRKELRFAGKAIRNHARLLQVVWRIAWRNATNLIDYRFLDGRSFRPKGVTFRISGQCNLNCQMCIYRHTGLFDTAQMLPISIMTEVIDEVHPFGLFVAFTGGEPLLHPHIVECISYVKEKGLHCSLTTNGWKLTERAADIAESGLDLLAVSIDGPEEMHDRIRGRIGSHQRAFDGIREVAGIEKRPLLFVNTSLQAGNYASLDLVVDEAAEAGVDGMNIQVLWSRPSDRAAEHNSLFPQYPVGEGWADRSLLQIDFQVLERVLNRARSKSLFVNLFPNITLQQMATWYTDPAQSLDNRRPKCPWMMANVFHDGTVRMCDDIIIGDLREDGFWEIWNSERMVEFRRTLRENKHFPICAGCCGLYRDHAM